MGNNLITDILDGGLIRDFFSNSQSFTNEQNELSFDRIVNPGFRREQAKNQKLQQKALEFENQAKIYNQVMGMLGDNPTLEAQQRGIGQVRDARLQMGIGDHTFGLEQQNALTQQIAQRNAARDAIAERMGMDRRLVNMVTEKGAQEFSVTRAGHLSSNKEQRETNRLSQIGIRQTESDRIAAQEGADKRKREADFEQKKKERKAGFIGTADERNLAFYKRMRRKNDKIGTQVARDVLTGGDGGYAAGSIPDGQGGSIPVFGSAQQIVPLLTAGSIAAATNVARQADDLVRIIDENAHLFTKDTVGWKGKAQGTYQSLRENFEALAEGVGDPNLEGMAERAENAAAQVAVDLGTDSYVYETYFDPNVPAAVAMAGTITVEAVKSQQDRVSDADFRQKAESLGFKGIRSSAGGVRAALAAERRVALSRKKAALRDIEASQQQESRLSAMLRRSESRAERKRMNRGEDRPKRSSAPTITMPEYMALPQSAPEGQPSKESYVNGLDDKGMEVFGLALEAYIKDQTGAE